MFHFFPIYLILTNFNYFYPTFTLCFHYFYTAKDADYTNFHLPISINLYLSLLISIYLYLSQQISIYLCLSLLFLITISLACFSHSSSNFFAKIFLLYFLSIAFSNKKKVTFGFFGKIGP